MDGTVNQGTPFTDAGFRDVETGAALFHALKLPAYSLTLPSDREKLKQIASYLNDHPDPTFEIGKVARSNKNPNVSQLDHFAAYVQLVNGKRELENKIKEYERQIRYYG